MSKKKKLDQRKFQPRGDGSRFLSSFTPNTKNLLSLGILYIIILFLFREIVFENKIFSDSGDTAAAQSWAEAGDFIKKTENVDPQWFPYPFSGMPAFGSLAYSPRDVNYLQSIVHFIGKLLFFNAELSWMVLHYFLAGVFMFLLLRFWDFKRAPSLLGAITFALSPYAVGLAAGGHGSKLMAWSYLPLVLLLTHALFQRRNVLSLGLLSATLGTLFLTNHVQMVFYVLFVVGLYSLYEIILDIRNQPLLGLKKGALLGIGLAVAFAMSAYVYLSVREYAQYSIRGGGEAGTAGGLAYDYATNWSFHPFELMNFLIPSFFGFRTPYYWGWMPFTESSVYIGLVPLILAAMALIYRRNRATIFLAILSAIIFIISFGKHFPILYDLLFNYLPYFNKFRTPSMILHLIPFTFGLLAAYGMTFLLEIPDREKEVSIAKLKKRVLITIGIIGVILIIGFLAGDGLYDLLSGSMFVKEGELQQLRAQYGQQAGQVLQQLKKIRFDLFWSGREIPDEGYVWNGYVRFAFFAVATLGLILLYLNRKVKAKMFSSAMVALLALDLLIIDGNFIQPRPNTALKQQFQPDTTINFLKRDSTLYRIFPLGDLFQDNTWMYHKIQSIGGYSPAKLKVYQDMIDSLLFHGWEKNFPLNYNVINMLNVKYLVAQGRLPEGKFTLVNVDQRKQFLVYQNPEVLPRAFFADTAYVVPEKKKIFELLNRHLFQPKRMAILEKKPVLPPEKAESSSVQMTYYGAHRIELQAYTSKPALLVLSEIYYPRGWKAYIDGNETEIYKTNYILRSIVVPEGKHHVEFRYDSEIYHIGLTTTHIAWVVSSILIIIGLVQHQRIRQRLMREPASEPQQANVKVYGLDQ